MKPLFVKKYRAGPTAAAGAGGRHFPGSKNGSGVWQAIVNQIPPHDIWIEAFAGTGAVTRHKRPARTNYVVDIDPRADCFKLPGVLRVRADAVGWLIYARGCLRQTRRVVVYADPPYLFSVRSCRRNYYRNEFGTEADHLRLLVVLKSLPWPVLLSGYHSDLYARELEGWREVVYPTSNRSGALVQESLWCNFPVPRALHQYDFLGQDFRERERIKRKKARWVARLSKMASLEARCLIQAVSEFCELPSPALPIGSAAVIAAAADTRSHAGVIAGGGVAAV